MKKTRRINPYKLESFLKGIKSEYEVNFFKKDGTNRKMQCSNNLPESKGLGVSPAKESNSYILVWDTEKKAHRLINIKTAYKVIVDNAEYEIH